MSSPNYLTHRAASKARVVKCTPCLCSLVASESSFHLAVETRLVDLVQGNAIAISYTWGEFDRVDICLGHRANRPEEKIIMNLGSEWIFPEFSQRLADLTDDCGALWIDQLCIPQRDDQIKATIAKIPVIYSTFEVVALLPGTLCRCLPRMLGDDLLQEDLSDAVESGVDDDAIRQCAVECFNATGFSSWQNRIWTRQELLYSKRIRVVWNITKNLPCVKGSVSITTSELQHLNPYAHCLFDKALAETSRNDLALWALINARTSSYAFMRSTLSEIYPVQNKNLALARFLLGVPFSKQEIEHSGMRFLVGLARISLQSRTATQSRDYVLSIWTDCPGYVVPDNFRTMSIGELLEDAMLQFENRYGITIPTYCPTGLFDPVTSGEIRWKPSKYLHEEDLKDLRDVYGPLLHPCKALPVLNDDSVPLQFLNNGPRSIMHRAEPYEKVYDGSQTTEALDFMTEVVGQWPSYLQVRLCELVSAFPLDMVHRITRILKSSSPEQSIELDETELGESLFLFVLVGRSELAHGQDIGDVEVFGRVIPRVNHRDVVYRIVVYVLRLDLSLCRSRNLHLVVTTEGSPCIGLTRSRRSADLDTPELIGRSEHQSAGHPRTKFLTVCLNLEFGPIFGYGLLETLCDPTMINPPRYHVVGVWTPTVAASHGEIGATPERGAADAFIC